MSRRKDTPIKVETYYVTYDKAGNRLEIPWEELSETEQCEIWQRAINRAMEAIGYRPATEQEIFEAKALGLI